MDTAVTRANSYALQSVSPDPNAVYVPRIRVVNAATAPAAATITVYYVVGSDYNDFQAEISGGSGDSTPGRGVPVTITSSPGTVPVSGSLTVTPGSSTTVAGTTAAKINAAATTNATLVKSTAGRVYGYHLANTTATWRYLKLYNKTTAPVPGTDTPVAQVAIPPNGAVTVDLAVPYAGTSAGIGYAITAAPADLDATAVAAGDVVGYLLFA